MDDDRQNEDPKDTPRSPPVAVRSDAPVPQEDGRKIRLGGAGGRTYSRPQADSPGRGDVSSCPEGDLSRSFSDAENTGSEGVADEPANGRRDGLKQGNGFRRGSGLREGSERSGFQKRSSSSDGEMRGAVGGNAARQKRRAKKFTESRAKNIAEIYIAQREASTGMVRALLRRRANSWLRVLDEGEREAAADEVNRIIEAEVSRLVAKRYVDDTRFARMKVRSGLASGKGIARIARELGQKGLGAEELEEGLATGTASFVEDRSRLLAPQESEPDPTEMRREAEQEAARIFARKKRIGPWRKAPLPEDFKEARKIWNREAGAMARAGYSFDLIREILDGEPAEEWRDY